MCHKLAQIIHMSRMNCDTIYIKTYTGAVLFQNFNTTFKCNHDLHGIISKLNSCYFNCTDGMAHELRYGMIKYNIIEKTFVFIDKNRTMIYDSRVGYLDLKVLSLKDKLESGEINKLIAYTRQVMVNATYRKIPNSDNYQFYFNKLFTLKSIKNQIIVLTKEMLTASFMKSGMYIASSLSAIIYI